MNVLWEPYSVISIHVFGIKVIACTHALVRPRYSWKNERKHLVVDCNLIIKWNECCSHATPFGGRNPKVGVNHVHPCMSPFHVHECLLSQFYFCINDIVANGLKYTYNKVCFIALIGSCIMCFVICMKWPGIVFFWNNCTEKGPLKRWH